MADPRQLQPSINGQATYSPYVSQPNDPYTGERISAEPSLLRKIVGMFMDKTDPGIGPQALETVGARAAEALAPHISGMVLSPENVQIIKKALAGTESLTGVPNAPITKTDLAWKYIQTKYPKLASIPEAIRNHLNPQDSSWGYYDDQNKILGIQNAAKQTLSDLTDTIGHELTHARQAQVDPIGLNTAYIPHDVSLFKYLDQSWERNARQGGSTAAKGFNKFIQQAFPPYDLDKHISQLPEFMQEVVVPGLQKRQDYITNMQELKPSMPSPETLQSLQKALNADIEMVTNHLNSPDFAQKNNRIPLTGRMLLDAIDTPAQAATKNSTYINPLLKDFLIKKGSSGVSPIINITTEDLLRSLLNK